METRRDAQWLWDQYRRAHPLGCRTDRRGRLGFSLLRGAYSADPWLPRASRLSANFLARGLRLEVGRRVLPPCFPDKGRAERRGTRGSANYLIPLMVPGRRLELLHLAVPDPKSGASANSAIPARALRGRRRSPDSASRGGRIVARIGAEDRYWLGWDLTSVARRAGTPGEVGPLHSTLRSDAHRGDYTGPDGVATAASPRTRGSRQSAVKPRRATSGGRAA